MSLQGIKYNVDIIICIDGTGSMGPVIGDVKNGALKFHEDLSAKMLEKSKSIDHLRLKVIEFRDFYHGDKVPLRESSFFSLPDDKEEFASFVNGIDADGGGDEPENGLEAVDIAIKSDWTQSGDKRRQVIVVWTDASAHPLEKKAGSKPANYPKGIAKDFNELTDNWESGKYVNGKEKRIIIFSPDAYPWTDISNNWQNAIHYSSQAGQGMEDVNYSEILNLIASSV